MIETWTLYAFGAFMGYFFFGVLIKYASADNPLLISMIMYASAAIVMLLLLSFKMEFSLPMKSIYIAILLGIASVTGTVFAIKSVSIAPNPGYTVAIYSASFVMVTIVSFFLFQAPFNMTKFIGVLTTLAGLILLSV